MGGAISSCPAADEQYYDFVFDTSSLMQGFGSDADESPGWPILVSNRFKNKLTDTDPASCPTQYVDEDQSQLDGSQYLDALWKTTVLDGVEGTGIPIIAVVGLFSRGKTFVLNRISKRKLPSGFGVNTKGLSAVLSEDNKLFLDTAGWQNPIRGADSLVEEMVDRLNTDNFNAECTLQLADVVLCVVKELTIDDQKVITRLAHWVDRSVGAKAQASVYVVHNYDSAKDEKEVWMRFCKHCIDCYPSGQLVQSKSGCQFYRTTERIKQKGKNGAEAKVQITHVPLGNDETMKRFNDTQFEFLEEQIIYTTKAGTCKGETPVSFPEQVLTVLSENVKNYVNNVSNCRYIIPAKFVTTASSSFAKQTSGDDNEQTGFSAWMWKGSQPLPPSKSGHEQDQVTRSQSESTKLWDTKYPKRSMKKYADSQAALRQQTPIRIIVNSNPSQTPSLKLNEMQETGFSLAPACKGPYTQSDAIRFDCCEDDFGFNIIFELPGVCKDSGAMRITNPSTNTITVVGHIGEKSHKPGDEGSPVYFPPKRNADGNLQFANQCVTYSPIGARGSGTPRYAGSYEVDIPYDADKFSYENRIFKPTSPGCVQILLPHKQKKEDDVFG